MSTRAPAQQWIAPASLSCARRSRPATRPAGADRRYFRRVHRAGGAGRLLQAVWRAGRAAGQVLRPRQPRPVPPLAGAELWPRGSGARVRRRGRAHPGGHVRPAALRCARRGPQGLSVHERQPLHGGTAYARRPRRPLHGLARP